MSLKDAFELGRKAAKPQKEVRERILFAWDFLDDATALYARGYAVKFLINEIIGSTKLEELDLPGDILIDTGSSFQVLEVTPYWVGGSYHPHNGDWDDPDLKFKDPVWRLPTEAEWEAIRSGALEKLDEVWKDIPEDQYGEEEQEASKEAEKDLPGGRST